MAPVVQARMLPFITAGLGYYHVPSGSTPYVGCASIGDALMIGPEPQATGARLIQHVKPPISQRHVNQRIVRHCPCYETRIGRIFLDGLVHARYHISARSAIARHIERTTHQFYSIIFGAICRGDDDRRRSARVIPPTRYDLCQVRCSIRTIDRQCLSRQARAGHTSGDDDRTISHARTTPRFISATAVSALRCASSGVPPVASACPQREG